MNPTPSTDARGIVPVFDENNVQIYHGDCRAVLAQIPAASVDCVVTSPPYFGLRSYGIGAEGGEIGQEQTPEAFVAELVAVFRGVWRVLKDTGVIWVNLGDSYAGSGKGGNPPESQHQKQRTNAGSLTVIGQTARDAARTMGPGMDQLCGLKPKDLIGIPWRVAFALQADGWYLRSEIIWHKLNPMPESVTDRPTKAHEQIFLLSKSERYYYDAEAIAEPAAYSTDDRASRAQLTHKFMPTDLVNGIRPRSWKGSDFHDGKNLTTHPNVGKNRKSVSRHKQELLGRCASETSSLGSNDEPLTRNLRSVWSIASQPYSGAHFATFPPKLIKPCIKAGVPDGGVCLDPFFGAGTTGLVCQQQHVRCIGIELNRDYIDIAARRLSQGVLDFTPTALDDGRDGCESRQ